MSDKEPNENEKEEDAPNAQHVALPQKAGPAKTSMLGAKPDIESILKSVVIQFDENNLSDQFSQGETHDKIGDQLVQLAYFKPKQVSSDYQESLHLLELEKLNKKFISDILHVAPFISEEKGGNQTSKQIEILNMYFFEQKKEEAQQKSNAKSSRISKSNKQESNYKQEFSQISTIGFRDTQNFIEYQFGKLDHCHYILFTTIYSPSSKTETFNDLSAPPAKNLKNTTVPIKRSPVFAKKEINKEESKMESSPKINSKQNSVSRIRDNGFL